jgi:bidirectional [NiFe] hydrogenase diaphorase subunit
MPDVARFFMEFCADESCGKCAPCRVGTPQLLRLLERITQGRASMADLRKLEDLCKTVGTMSLCGLGQSAPNPVLSTLRYFRDEYEAHILERRCPAGVCSMADLPAAAGAGA